MKQIKFLALCLCATFSFAQQKLNKTSQSIKVNKDVEVQLNTSYVEIELDTWNKDVVEIEAYIAGKKLSEDALVEALEAWELDIEAEKDKVVINSENNAFARGFRIDSYDDVLHDLEFELADFPEISEVIVMPNIPDMDFIIDIPEIQELPKMPKFPKLPKLPKGVNSVQFDYDKYQAEGEAYLEEWSKRFEKQGGSKLREDMEAWAKAFAESDYENKMKQWGDDFAEQFEGEWADKTQVWSQKYGDEYAEKMEAWGEDFGERFGEEWAEKMEAWGKRFARQMEHKIIIEEHHEKRKEELNKRKEELHKRKTERAKALKNRLKNKKKIKIYEYKSKKDNPAKKVIKLKIPKKAKLKLNVKHGELKVSSVLHNATGNIAYGFLAANNIDGSNTSINVSYSPVVINKWNTGTLNLNFVDNANVKQAHNIMLYSKSSNVTVDNITDVAVIDGSFGDLNILNVAPSFKNINLVLKNTDALVNIPEDIGYHLYFMGSRSKLNDVPTQQKTINTNPMAKNHGKTVTVNAKFSHVTLN